MAAPPVLPIERRIWLIRGRRVMLDSDLAEIYGVPTKRLNEQVRRNLGRFPADFMLRLTLPEATAIRASRPQYRIPEANAIDSLRSQNATLNARGRHVKYRPYAFTEHGAVMLASVLNSPLAVQASVQVVRAFVRLRETLAVHKTLALRMERIERDSRGHAARIDTLFDEIQRLQDPPPPKPRKIGFELKGSRG